MKVVIEMTAAEAFDALESGTLIPLLKQSKVLGAKEDLSRSDIADPTQDEARAESTQGDIPSDGTPEEKKEEEKLTLEDVRKVFAKKTRLGTEAKKRLKEILKEAGVSKLPELPPEHYAAAIEKAEAI